MTNWYESTAIIYGLIGVLSTVFFSWRRGVDIEICKLRDQVNSQQVGSATILAEIRHIQEDVKWIKSKYDKQP